MKPLGIVATALVLMFATACGGGSSSAPSTPTAPTPTPTPTPATITVYASYDNRPAMSSGVPGIADTVYATQALGVGWEYGDIPPYGRHTAGFASTLKFDLGSQTPGRTVTKATLRLHVRTVRQDFAITPQILVSAFIGDWNPATLTWNICSALGTQTTGEAQATAPSAVGAPLDFDVTTIIRNWASGTWPNFGLRLWVNQHPDPGGRESVGTTVFDSLETASEPGSRPQLIIEYQ